MDCTLRHSAKCHSPKETGVCRSVCAIVASFFLICTYRADFAELEFAFYAALEIKNWDRFGRWTRVDEFYVSVILNESIVHSTEKGNTWQDC